MDESVVFECAIGLAAIVGRSAWTKAICAQVRRVAHAPSNVLIIGPTGTGKELIARAIHAHSPRASQPFIPVDCASVSTALFASQLFGHVKGAFSGATCDELGCFRAAHGGTVFLDEIGDSSAEQQSRLLRVLQERTVVPVGSHQEMPVDVRVVAATSRELKQEVAARRFREDLYFRLGVVLLENARLKDRPEDIEVLVPRILAKLVIDHGLPSKRMSYAALALAKAYDWPGNVRELENVLERAVMLSEGELLEPQSILPHLLARHDASAAPVRSAPPGDVAGGTLPRVASWPTLAEVEMQHLQRTLQATNGNQSRAAHMLGMNRYRLRRAMVKYGLDKSTRQPPISLPPGALASPGIPALQALFS